jgi:hypothetical protein
MLASLRHCSLPRPPAPDFAFAPSFEGEKQATLASQGSFSKWNTLEVHNPQRVQELIVRKHGRRYFHLWRFIFGVCAKCILPSMSRWVNSPRFSCL